MRPCLKQNVDFTSPAIKVPIEIKRMMGRFMNEKHSIYLYIGCNCALFVYLHGIRLTLQKLIFGFTNTITFKMRVCSG